MTTIGRDAVRSVLRDWIEGRVSASQVHTWASEHHSSKFEPEDDVVNEVLGDLDMLDLNLRTVEDAPVLLKMLEYSEAQLPTAIALLNQHADSIDLEARRRALRADPLYKAVCDTSDGTV